MKDVSNTTTTTKAARLSIYPKKRPSPVRDGGIAKARKSPAHPALRRTPCAPELQRVREAQLLSQVRDTRLLEEEYRYDILRYMHDMEVRPPDSAPVPVHSPPTAMHHVLCLVYGPPA